MIPITDAIGALSRLEAEARFEEATRLACAYPIVQLVRIAPHIDDRLVRAAIAYAVQRRASAREAFEAFVGFVDDETLWTALYAYWAVRPVRQLVWQYADLVGGGVLSEMSASQTVLWFLERGAQPLTVARVIATAFSDDEVLAALHENALGMTHIVALLHCIQWPPDRVARALARRGFLPFEIEMLV
jgi:hypothetical protein